MNELKRTKTEKIIEKGIFGSRWLLIPFYYGLTIVMIIYTFVYIKEIIHLVAHINEITTSDAMMTVLEIIDIVMIANLVKMIITGSYHSFVCKDHGYENEKASSWMLKIKIATSIVVVSSIHLLQTFIHLDKQSVGWDIIQKQMAIHGIFIAGALALGIIEYLHEKIQYNKE